MNIADQVLFLKSQEKHKMDETISEEVTKKEDKSKNKSEKHFDEKKEREDTTLDLTAKDGKTSEIKTREESIIDCITRFLDNLIIILLILVIFSLLSNLVYYMRFYLF